MISQYRCCVHTATLIYFLSNQKHLFAFKSPADHLNDIFVDVDKKEPSNRSKNVRVNISQRKSQSFCSIKFTICLIFEVSGKLFIKL